MPLPTSFAIWPLVLLPPIIRVCLRGGGLHSFNSLQKLAAEPYINPENYVKHNNNWGFVHPLNRNTPQAFSHFSWEFTGHRFMVVDIQVLLHAGNCPYCCVLFCPKMCQRWVEDKQTTSEALEGLVRVGESCSGKVRVGGCVRCC